MSQSAQRQQELSADPRSWADRLRQHAPAWMTSVTVHLLVLVLLALITNQLPQQHELLAVLGDALESPELLSREYVVEDGSHRDRLGTGGTSGAFSALTSAPEFADVPSIDPQALEPAPVEIALDEMSAIAASPEISTTLVVKGRVDVGVSSAAGAIDRLTQVIRESLEQRPTVVVWIFDQSGSLQGQRKTFLDRFDRVYRELGLIEAAGDSAFQHDTDDDDSPLVSSVLAFGQDVSERTQRPTSDVAQLKAAVEKIETDPSGVERVFAALERAVALHKRFRSNQSRRNVLLVLVSDEAGDDQTEADRVTALCQRLEMPVYCLGIPAPFGLRESVVKYVDPDPQYDQTPRYLPVFQGPETPIPETVQIAFRDSPPEPGFEALDSGFGPYALTRLCYETGGEYFAMHPQKVPQRAANRNEPPVMSAVLREFFNPQVMRRYQPEYVSLERYRRTLDDNKARAALVQAAELSRLEPMRNPRRAFPKRDEAELKRFLDEAQRDAAVLEPKLAALYQILDAGRADRKNLTEPRWQAGYDLALGRVLAVRVRTEGYNATLAQLKQGRAFADPQNDTWLLEPDEKVSVNSTLEGLSEEAHTLLQRVVTEHAETPWAALAQRELDEPLGWAWKEIHTGVNDAPRPMPQGGQPRPPQDRLRQLPRPPAPQREVRL